MRKPSVEFIFDRFFGQINWYTNLLVKVTETESLELDALEKREIFEAFVLKIYVAWEVLVEDVVVECLCRDSSQYAEHKTVTLPKKMTRNLCRCLISGLGYFDFRDTGDLKGWATKILADRQNPFKDVLPDKKIDEFYIIRNYLAHYSDASKQSLTRMYRRNYDLSFRGPGDFLLDTVEFVELGERGKQTRFADYTNAFTKGAEKMETFFKAT
ncbi:MAG: hypothetical protein ISS79_07595 [Phycisphaerae bacterium]|nr:hypothetical protein [Phycisphaerae bacterium]